MCCNHWHRFVTHTHRQQTQTVETLARPLAHTTHPGGRDAIGILYSTKKCLPDCYPYTRRVVGHCCDWISWAPKGRRRITTKWKLFHYWCWNVFFRSFCKKMNDDELIHASIKGYSNLSSLVCIHMTTWRLICLDLFLWTQKNEWNCLQ